jgi:hypothetical protein
VVDLVPKIPQILRHPEYIVERDQHILFVDQLYQLLIVGILFTGRIVEAAAGHIQQRALAY